MVSDRIYELCQATLEDEKLGEEEKTDKLEELLGSEPHKLKGKALEDAVLGALWRWKSSSDAKPSPVLARAAVRPRSPAAWLQHRASTPSITGSPRPGSSSISVPPGLEAHHPLLSRTRSSNASPFTSPKPSPRMLFGDPSPASESYVDYGSDAADWLAHDETSSNTSYGDGGASSDFMAPFAADMTPYDMLRSVLQDNRTDEELEHTLEANGWDLSQAINALMEQSNQDPVTTKEPAQTFLIGKSMSPSSRPVTPAGQQKSPIVCRYWLISGHCARADCRFAHSIENHVCKFWLQGGCLAGNTCQFSHDPAAMMQQLSIANSGSNTPQQYPNFRLQDYDSFPSLQPTTSNPYDESTTLDPDTLNAVLQQQQMLNSFPYIPNGPRNTSRPTSRHATRTPTPNAQPNFNDDEAFPSLGSAAMNKPGKRHHGKRGGHGHHSHSNPPQPSSLADVVRLSPSPAATPSPNSRDALRRGLRNGRSFTSSREHSNAASAIPAPKEIPWLETGDHVNRAYLKARAEAIRHGGLRNKFLQSAAQAWNRNDARGAKALSLRGQNENQLMRDAHREAAQALYEERNKQLARGSTRELYVDLHGLHAEEAVSYLQNCLKDHTSSARPVYVITGTGHHSKNGKDKIGKAVRQFLVEWRCAFREFSVPGDRNNVGGILGIDPSTFSTFDAESAESQDRELSSISSGAAKKESSKVLLVRHDPRKVEQSMDAEHEVLESG